MPVLEFEGVKRGPLRKVINTIRLWKSGHEAYEVIYSAEGHEELEPFVREMMLAILSEAESYYDLFRLYYSDTAVARLLERRGEVPGVEEIEDEAFYLAHHDLLESGKLPPLD